MKKIAATLTLAALFAPLLAAAAGPSFRLIDVTRSDVKPEIADFSKTDGEDASLAWETLGAGQSELSVRCRGKERLSVTVDDVVSYVRCDGKLRTVYRGRAGADKIASLEVTGDRRVTVYSLIKLYRTEEDGERGRLIDKEKEVVKVLPSREE